VPHAHVVTASDLASLLDTEYYTKYACTYWVY